MTHPKIIIICTSVLLFACAEPGTSGNEGVDCGPHGSPHDGHCHCHEGYLLSDETCVSPDKIILVCGETIDAGTAEDTETEAHHHEACRCPETDACPCDGKQVTIGGVDYCSPEIEHE